VVGEEKTRIVGETPVAGANVSAIARSNGLDPSQLFAWPHEAKGSRVVAPFVGVPNKPVKPARFEAVQKEESESICCTVSTTRYKDRSIAAGKVPR